jgi:hypothetical protein
MAAGRQGLRCAPDAKLVIAAALLLAACSSQPVHLTTAAPACALGDADRAWIDRALAAWRYSASSITGIGRIAHFETYFFDAECLVSSSDALADDAVSWTATPHHGSVPIPGDQHIPVGVTSFAQVHGNRAYLVMSTPSVWRAHGIDNRTLGLETMMVAVLLHEGSHVSQAATYAARMGEIAGANHLPQSFNDDSIQLRFEGNADFSRSIALETELLLDAATAADVAITKRLARRARELMRKRAARFFTGEDQYLAEAEDIWLTMEGAGQWAAYRWVIDPLGAGVAPDVAFADFARGHHWWSQNQGLALFLVLDRLDPDAWKSQVFGGGRETILQLMDQALAGPSPAH